MLPDTGEPDPTGTARPAQELRGPRLRPVGRRGSGGVRGVEAALIAQGVDLGVLLLAQLRVQRDAEDVAGVGQPPSDIPVRDELPTVCSSAVPDA